MKESGSSFYKRGASLIELMVGVVLMAIVIAVGTAFWIQSTGNYNFFVSQYSIIDIANQSIRQMSNELRQTREAMNGAYPLAILEDNQLAYYADLVGDGTVVRVRYFVEGTKLFRGITQPSGNPPAYDVATERIQLIADGLALDGNPIFVYYDGNWPGDTENNPLPYWQRPLETRLIEIRLALEYQSGQSTQVYETSSTVQLRNLKSNL
jgi:hypothetical protein